MVRENARLLGYWKWPVCHYMGNYKLGLVLNCWVQQRFPMVLSATEINKHSTALHLEVWEGLLKVFLIIWIGIQLNLRGYKYITASWWFSSAAESWKTNFGPLLRWSSPLAPATQHRTPLPSLIAYLLSSERWLCILVELRCQGLCACHARN